MLQNDWKALIYSSWPFKVGDTEALFFLLSHPPTKADVPDSLKLLWAYIAFA